MLLSIISTLLFGQSCLAQSGAGTIGMGIKMYKPVCSYACHDSLSSLYLSCTTFDSGDLMADMDMKIKKRMDMGSAEGTTSSVCRANDTVWLQTFAYCIQQNCAVDGVSKSDMESSWEMLAADGDAVPEMKTVLPASAPIVEVDSDSMWLNETQLVNGDLYFATRQTLSEFAYQEEIHTRFGVIIMVVATACFLLGGAYIALDSSKGGSALPVWVSKYLALPALVSSRHQVPLPWNFGYVPSRSLSLFILFYVALNIILCSVPYKSVWPNTYSTWFASTTSEISMYVGNRTGILCLANLALAILFAGRNNPISWVTGFSQTTSLTFHRWAARVATLQAIVHSIIYTYTYYIDGGSASAFYSEATKAYFWWGIIATLALSLSVAVSILPFRLKHYDVFLIIHILLAVLTLVATWYHIYLRFYERWGYKIWLYISFSFWVFDRFMRFARIVFYNWMGYNTEATAELLPGGELIKLTLYPGRAWSFAPGQHTFLYFPGIGKMWESHPFSISAWTSFGDRNEPDVGGVERLNSLEKTSEPEITATVVNSSHSSTHSLPQPQQIFGTFRPGVSFIIRPGKGATRALHKHLASRSSGPQQIDVLTEGPYGHAANLRHFDRVLCIGGGIGITALLPYVQNFASISRGIDEKQTGGRKQGMMLAWTAKEKELTDTVRKMIPAEAIAAGLEVRLGVTHGEEERMDVGEVVKGELRKVEKGGRLAVVVCGPAGLADEARKGVANLVGENEVRISLFEESFTW